VAGTGEARMGEIAEQVVDAIIKQFMPVKAS